MDRHIPFVVPGFGCSYWEPSVAVGSNSDLELFFLHRDNTHPRIPPLFRDKRNVVTILTALEAGRGQLSWPGFPAVAIDAREWVGLVHPDWTPKARIPKKTNHPLKEKKDAGASTEVFTLKVLVLRFHEPAFLQLHEEFGIKREDFLNAMESGRSLPKSFWIEEVLHRMIFERLLAQRHDSLSSRFCETELLKEIFFSWQKMQKRAESKNSKKKEPLASSAESLTTWTSSHATPQLQRALRFVEENLHKDLTVDAIAKASAMSSSTLLRLFKQYLDTTPLKHVWRRRLQEARLLIQSGGYTLLEVAHHARFSSGAAFTKAFIGEFGEPPRFATHPEKKAPRL